jgi:hypothetical protein
MRLKSMFMLALIVPKLGIAGGTLGTDELGDLLAQMPAVRDLIHANLVLSESAFAQIRLGSHFKELGGARVGPYTIGATSKKDDGAVLVVLCTKARFLDKAGHEVPEARIEQAVSIDEKLTGVMLRQGGTPFDPPGC